MLICEKTSYCRYYIVILIAYFGIFSVFHRFILSVGTCFFRLQKVLTQFLQLSLAMLFNVSLLFIWKVMQLGWGKRLFNPLRRTRNTAEVRLD